MPSTYERICAITALSVINSLVTSDRTIQEDLNAMSNIVQLLSIVAERTAETTDNQAITQLDLLPITKAIIDYKKAKVGDHIGNLIQKIGKANAIQRNPLTEFPERTIKDMIDQLEEMSKNVVIPTLPEPLMVRPPIRHNTTPIEFTRPRTPYPQRPSLTLDTTSMKDIQRMQRETSEANKENIDYDLDVSKFQHFLALHYEPPRVPQYFKPSDALAKMMDHTVSRDYWKGMLDYWWGMIADLKRTAFKGQPVDVAIEGPDHRKVFFGRVADGLFIVGATQKAVAQALVDGLDAAEEEV